MKTQTKVEKLGYDVKIMFGNRNGQLSIVGYSATKNGHR